MDFHSEISFDSFNMKILDRWSSSLPILEDSSAHGTVAWPVPMRGACDHVYDLFRYGVAPADPPITVSLL